MNRRIPLESLVKVAPTKSVVKSIGHKFSMLLVVSYFGNRGHYPYVACRCDCGKDTVVSLHSVRCGCVQSCGCLRDKQAAINAKLSITTHGKSRTPAYFRWRDMNTRCYNPNSTAYASYGGDGIGVCKEWREPHGFAQFHKDMGDPQSGDSVERKDNNRDYSPGNCFWLPRRLQAKNRRYNWTVSINCVTMTAADATKKLNLGKDVIAAKLRAGNHTKGTPVPIEQLLP